MLISFSAFAQNTFDRSLGELSAEIAEKLQAKEKKKIVVLYVTDINKSQTVAGKYMADVISVHIVNNAGNFEVFDRENLSGIAEAKKMIAEGYIDANQAKQLGKILAVDAIIIGNYTVLSTTLKLTLKALDVNNGFVIAAGMKDLPINADAGALLGISVGSGSSDLNANKGFNRPMNSNESYNNPETVSKNCEINNTGDYCFTNGTNLKLKVLVNSRSIQGRFSSNRGVDYSLILIPGQTQCFYNMKVNPYNYYFFDITKHAEMYDYQFSGQINVEQCKSKTFVIK